MKKTCGQPDERFQEENMKRERKERKKNKKTNDLMR
jgi:hypothetical protein